jgi:hypothetical protein
MATNTGLTGMQTSSLLLFAGRYILCLTVPDDGLRHAINKKAK